jgi:hypothetical protein
MTVTIRVPWENPYDKDHQWNELLAWTVETYGLPGERVSFHPTERWMDFTFDNEQDALMFQIKTGGHIRTKEEYTVKFVGEILNGYI